MIASAKISPCSLIKQWAWLLTVITFADIGNANVDPGNATYFTLDDDFDPLMHFNVTNPYYRRLILTNNLYTFDGKHCVPSMNTEIHYWINPYELPDVIRLYDITNAIFDIRDKQQIYTIIAKTVARVFKEMPLPARELSSYKDYYNRIRDIYGTTMKKNDLLLINNKATHFLLTHLIRIDSGNDYPPPFLPIQIHFRSLPYPQSSFLEFVSNRDRRWEVYHDSLYPGYAGGDNDLLYRFRHNLRHSLGLGHVIDKRCIMFPNNIPKLSAPCDHENIALHRLLCDPKINIRYYAYGQRAPK